MNTETLVIKLRRLDEIKSLPGNARIHDIPSIQQKIRQHGFLDPMGVSAETGHNLDGNGRLEALKLMYAAGEKNPKNIVVKREKVNGKLVNVWYAPTVDLHFDRESEGIVAASLNKAHDDGKTNEQALLAILEQAAAFDRLDETGYDHTALAALAEQFAPAQQTQPPWIDEEDDASRSGNSKSSSGSSSKASPGAHPAAPPPAPPDVRSLQLFLAADDHQLLIARLGELMSSNRYETDAGTPPQNISELVYCLVRDAVEALEKGGDT